jgi:amino acid transporter
MDAISPDGNGSSKPQALAMLASARPRNLGWFGAAGLLFGDWGTSRLYVLGIAFAVAGRSSFVLIAGMSLLILAVAWAYTQICRIYPDGGGVYTAARHRSALLGVVGALLLFADYTITASLSAVDAFHYFGLGQHSAQVAQEPDAGSRIIIHSAAEAAGGEVKAKESIWHWKSPALWAIVSIGAIGAFNLMGPKHSAGFALFAATGMVAITLMVVVFALPQIDWRHLDLGSIHQPPMKMWEAFV